MNKNLYVIALLGFNLCFSSCSSLSKNQTTDSDSLNVDSIEIGTEKEEFLTQKIQFRDSLILKDRMPSYYTLNIEVPQGNGILSKSIKKWMKDCLSKDYKGDADFSNKMLKEISSDFLSDVDEDNEYAVNNREMNIKVVYESDDYVSYEVQGYDYFGGAHDLPFHYGKTFDKHNGEIISDKLFVKTDGLPQIVKKYLASYFEETSDVGIDDILFENAQKDFPLPSTGGWLVKDGVKVVYAAYEIAPYAVGLPECIIPYDELKGYLADGIVK